MKVKATMTAVLEYDVDPNDYEKSVIIAETEAITNDPAQLLDYPDCKIHVNVVEVK